MYFNYNFLFLMGSRITDNTTFPTLFGLYIKIRLQFVQLSEATQKKRYLPWESLGYEH